MWLKGMMHEWLEMAAEGGGATPQKPVRGAWAFLGEMGSQGRAQGQGALGVGRISLVHRGH